MDTATEMIFNTITEIEEGIDLNFESFNLALDNKISLYSGFTGVALFYGYLGKHTNNDHYFDKCQQVIEFCIDNLNSTYQPSLYGGFTGVAWTLRHLTNLGVFDNDSLSTLETIDPIIEKSTDLFINEQYYSLMYGLIGQGVYYLEQIENKSTGTIDPMLCLQRIVNSLYDMALIDGDSVTWVDHKSTLSKKSSSPIFNLGLPHGITGIMCFLSKAFEVGVEQDKISYLLKASVKWLLKHKNNFYDLSYYPPLIGENYTPHLTRLSWSYGDLCASIALLKASVVLNDAMLRDEALNTALVSVSRDLKTSIIYSKTDGKFHYLDVGLCKGTGGTIMLYSNLNKYFDNEALKKAQDFWVSLSLSSKNDNTGIGGYKSYVSTDGETAEWKEDIGFLDGISGTGLTMISLLNPSLNQWQRLLLM